VRARGPGRVNLLGEHTDYNAGLCLPFAVGAGVTVSAERTESGVIEAHAPAYGEDDRFDTADPQPAEGWRAFVRGTVAELNAAGATVPGARLRIESDLPEGAGLSSSAALGSALCLALLAVARQPEPERRELARLCSRVENDWVGAQTGLLDQMAAFFGEPGHALLLDCRDLSVEQVPLELRGWTLGVADSGSRHATRTPATTSAAASALVQPRRWASRPFATRTRRRRAASPSRSTGACGTSCARTSACFAV
jgi:galactokinase